MPMTENDNIMIVAVCLAANVPKIFHYAVRKIQNLRPGNLYLFRLAEKNFLALYGKRHAHGRKVIHPKAS